MAEIVESGARRRKLAAILHADVAGFSRVMGADEDGTHRVLGALRRAVDPLIIAHGGRIVGTAGDSLLADFASVVDALGCALEMQRAARTINDPLPPERRLELRIGVNLGDVIVDGDDIFGDGVNIAARLQQLAQPGAICIAQTVYDHVKNKLAVECRPLGPQRVKNIAEPIRAYAVGAPVAAPRPRKRRPVLLLAGAAAAAAITAAAGAGLWLFLARPPQPGAVEVAGLAAPERLAGRPSIAVLPFDNLSGGSGQDYFSDGITEDVIAALGRFSNLLVVAKSASFAVKGRVMSPAEIGRLLDVRFLLAGSVRRAGDRVRVGAELTEAATGRHLWSDAYDGEVRDIFAVQQDIARHVAGAAAVKLTRFEQQRVLANPTGNLKAYDYVLRGRDFLSHATRRENDEAQAMFQRAIDLDPNFAAAYAGLGRARLEAVFGGWTEFPTAEVEAAEALGRKALAIDPATSSAYQLLANVDVFRRRYDLALNQIDRALEVNPSDADSYDTRGDALVWAGKAADAIPWLEGALRFDRADGHAMWELCMAYYFVGRYADAVAVGDRALDRSPGRTVQTTTHPFLAAAYAQLGRSREAEDERAAMLRLSPFFNAEEFSDQFGTKEARQQLLEGLRKAGFQ